MLAALEPQLGVVQELLVAGAQGGLLELEHHAPAALRGVEAEAERLAVLGVTRDPPRLLELLRARLSLPRARARPEARDKALETRYLRLLALDRAAEGKLPRRALLAPGVPRAGEVAPLAALELEHRRAHRLEEPAVVRDGHYPGVDRG